ncbi:MAG TPA: hypothetical protein VKI17_04545, partial [Gemmataceae bacterium]|nr:hypothetical protein [Gemmataceae bacterium]
GTSRIHTNPGGGLLGTKGGGGGMGALDRKDNGDRLVIRPREDRLKDKLKDANKNDQLLANNQRRDDRDKKKKAGQDLIAKVDDSKLDPTKIWQEALRKGVNDPGLIIACADYLGTHATIEHLVEFLKADLRQGVLVRPWVYDLLALSLEVQKASPDEIERVRLSSLDLESQDAQSYVEASKAMAKLGRYDRAVAFCRQAALLEPNAPAPYEEALVVAELSKDSTAMEWAAGGLLRRDWPVDNDELHQKAASKLQNLARTLAAGQRQGEAQRMLASAQSLHERDLVVVLSWQGEADLDLEVREPIGTTCSFMQRQTPGGGTLLGDTLSDMTRETYVAAKAFSGEYQLTLRRIWGRPLGGKATLEIIAHQGTPQESRRRETVTFDRNYGMSVSLEEGRRTSTAYVPPPNATPRKKETAPRLTPSDQIFTKLRMLANPEFGGSDDSGMKANLAALGLAAPAKDLPGTAGKKLADNLVFQTKLQSIVGNGADLTAETTVLDDKTVAFKLSPVFQTANKKQSMPTVGSPLIPGGADQAGSD